MEKSRGEIDKLRSSLAGLGPKIGAILLGLSSSQIVWKPAPDSRSPNPWCIAECVEHLTITARLYLEQLQLVELTEVETKPGPATRAADWLTTKLILHVAPNSKIRLPAPKKFRPRNVPSAISSTGSDIVTVSAVLGEFVRVHDQLAKFLSELKSDSQLKNLRVGSPASNLISMQLRQGFQLLIAHANRHIGQIERVKNDKDFPRA